LDEFSEVVPDCTSQASSPVRKTVKMNLVVLLTFVVVSSSAPCTVPPGFLTLSQQYPFESYKVGLSKPMMNGLYTFCWAYNAAANNITFVIAAKNRGWIGFGVTAGGGMTNTDIMVFQKDVLGNNIVKDYFSKSSHHGPRLDRSQDVMVHGTYMSMVSETFVHVVSRHITSCDPWDVSLNLNGPTEIVVAFGKLLDYGLEFGEPREIEMHNAGMHDTVKVDLFAGQAPVVIPAGAPGTVCKKKSEKAKKQI
jgi:hypothetical protein